MSFEEMRKDLLNGKPDQWCVVFSSMGSEIKDHGFNTLKEFAMADVGSGGLGLDEKQLKYLLHYNPKYKHIAEELEKEMGLIEVVESVPPVQKNGVNQHSGFDKNENIKPSEVGGTSKTYRIAKLKRDFGEEAVIEAAKTCKRQGVSLLVIKKKI